MYVFLHVFLPRCRVYRRNLINKSQCATAFTVLLVVSLFYFTLLLVYPDECGGLSQDHPTNTNLQYRSRELTPDPILAVRQVTGLTTNIRNSSSNKSTDGSFQNSEGQLANLSELAGVLNKFRERVAIKKRSVINPHNYDFILNVPKACKDKEVDIVISVPSRVERRNLINKSQCATAFTVLLVVSLFCYTLLLVYTDECGGLSQNHPTHTNLQYRSRELSPDPLLAVRQVTDLTSNIRNSSSNKSTDGRFQNSEGQPANLSELASVLSKFQERVAIKIRSIINPHNYDFILNVPKACKDKEVDIVISVPSRVESFEQRQGVRETWGQIARDAANKTVLLFFFGETADQELQKKLENESRVYGDIVQENFVDSYLNLSLKSVAIVRWTSLFCPHSKFLLKADDDMYINVPLLLSMLRIQLERGPLFILGRVHHGVSPYRYVSHKWFVPYSQYKYKQFPNYVSGTAYSMSTAAAMRIYLESSFVPLINMEDTYISGILADSASVPRVHDIKFNGHARLQPTGCAFREMVTAHGFSTEEMKTIHKELNDPKLNCSKNS
ncbi:beta-1,3-galactosyltransferase 1-like [Elysia marginata]|uniref:Beta-1,3-galactosyltransferase 1-like n=1 Tax=Elysia marginata TaxID=1093978 RepID=A0AAV4JQ57_9GAST|nr:beta-1,3-galactosyltransferase 1-like [Elysia marginata]